MIQSFKVLLLQTRPTINRKCITLGVHNRYHSTRAPAFPQRNTFMEISLPLQRWLIHQLYTQISWDTTSFNESKLETTVPLNNQTHSGPAFHPCREVVLIQRLFCKFQSVLYHRTHYKGSTVKPPIKKTSEKDKPPNKGQTKSILVYKLYYTK